MWKLTSTSTNDSWTLWIEPQLSLFVFSLSSLLSVSASLFFLVQMYAHCIGSRADQSSVSHSSHVARACVILSWVLFLISSTSPFTSSFFFIISLITLLFPLSDTFNFHDVVDKYRAHLLPRTLAPLPRTSLAQVMSPTSTTSRRLMNTTPRNPRFPWWLPLRRRHHRQDAPWRVPKTSRSHWRRRPVIQSGVASQSWQNGETRCLHLWLRSFKCPRNSETQLSKWTDEDSSKVTKRADSRWLSSRDSKTRSPGRVRQKKCSKVEWNDWVAKRRNLSISSRRRTTSRRSSTSWWAIIGTKSGTSWSSCEEKSRWAGRIEEVSEPQLRHYCEKKIGRGSRHYPWTHWQDTGITEWNSLHEWFKRFSGCWINSQWNFPRYQSTCVFPTSSSSWWNAEPVL